MDRLNKVIKEFSRDTTSKFKFLESSISVRDILLNSSKEGVLSSVPYSQVYQQPYERNFIRYEDKVDYLSKSTWKNLQDDLKKKDIIAIDKKMNKPYQVTFHNNVIQERLYEIFQEVSGLQPSMKHPDSLIEY